MRLETLKSFFSKWRSQTPTSDSSRRAYYLCGSLSLTYLLHLNLTSPGPCLNVTSKERASLSTLLKTDSHLYHSTPHLASPFLPGSICLHGSICLQTLWAHQEIASSLEHKPSEVRGCVLFTLFSHHLEQCLVQH